MIEDVLQKIKFEKRVVVDGQTKYIDVYIPETRVLIEQKSIDKDLDRKMPQSDGSMRTPFEQGRNYAQWMIPNETPLWIVTCNFKSFEIHDMNKPNEPAVIILLEEVRNKLPLFDFMFKKEVKELSHEMEISVKAGEIVGILYDKLIAQYKEPNDQSFKSLNALCVRLVFCLYAEDAGIFGSHMMFHDYLKDVPVNGFRKALIELFRILDTKIENRDKSIYERFGIQITFAHRTFRWDSEASLKAHVHCVIIGFGSAVNSEKKKIYQDNSVLTVDFINPYLLAGDTVFTPVYNF